MTEINSKEIAPLTCSCNILEIEKHLSDSVFLKGRYTLNSIECVHDGCLVHKHLEHNITFVFNKDRADLYNGVQAPFGNTLCQLSSRRNSVQTRCCYTIQCKIFLRENVQVEEQLLGWAKTNGNSFASLIDPESYAAVEQSARDTLNEALYPETLNSNDPYFLHFHLPMMAVSVRELWYIARKSTKQKIFSLNPFPTDQWFQFPTSTLNKFLIASNSLVDALAGCNITVATMKIKTIRGPNIDVPVAQCWTNRDLMPYLGLFAVPDSKYIEGVPVYPTAQNNKRGLTSSSLLTPSLPGTKRIRVENTPTNSPLSTPVFSPEDENGDAYKNVRSYLGV